jgi:hypothetical protein
VHVVQTMASTVVPSYLPSATPTAKSNGTLVTYTGAAGRVEVGLTAVAALVGGVAFLL